VRWVVVAAMPGSSDVAAPELLAASALGGTGTPACPEVRRACALFSANVGVAFADLSALLGAPAPGFCPIALSEVGPLMMKFYRDAVPPARPPRGFAPH
jgi:hypothetical protein